MILSQRKLRILICIVILIYFILYILVRYSGLFSIENLDMIKYITFFVFITAFLYAIVVIDKKIAIVYILYNVIGTFLFLFLISSVFTFKIADLFFWTALEINKMSFNKFNSVIIGYNYVFAIPYLVLLICEFSVRPHSEQPTVKKEQ
jgi:hypothetical protein